MCTFNTFKSLKVHLKGIHSEKRVVGGDSHDLTINLAFHCPVCDFKQPFFERHAHVHLRGHLRCKEMVHVHLGLASLKQMFTPHIMHINAENIKMHQTMM